MRKLIGNGGIDEEEEKVVEDERKRKEDKEEKRKNYGRKKGIKRLCWEKRRKINEEINFAMSVVATSSRPEGSKKEYLPCAISFAAHSLIFCTSIDTG